MVAARETTTDDNKYGKLARNRIKMYATCVRWREGGEITEKKLFACGGGVTSAHFFFFYWRGEGVG